MAEKIPVIVGVTGGIGSGKSTVCELFGVMGIPVFTADLVARNIVNEDPLVVDAIKRRFGQHLYAEGGELNRAAMAEIVFSDQNELAALNAIVHPAVARAFEVWQQAQKAPYVIKEAAILIETGGHEQCDHVILVSAPQEVRMERVLARDGVTKEAVQARMDKQWSEDEKAKFASFKVVNDGQTPLIPQVRAIHEQLKN